MSDKTTIGPLVLRGFVWKGISMGVTQGLRLIVAVILARLLAPHDYGLAGMVLVFASLIIVFSDLGFGAALVQRTELTEEDRSTVFWISLGAGALFTLVGFVLAGPIASFYGQPEVEPLFRALSVSFLITAAGTVQSTLLVREMHFRSLELRMMGSVVAGSIVGIWAAWAGYGAWAIIAQQVAIAAASTVLLWVFSPWKPRFVFSRASLRGLGGYSANVFGSRLLFYLNRNADNMLVGRFLGAAALGAYSIAYTIMLVPFSQIASPVQEVLFPAMARMQHDLPRMAESWLRANRIIAAISVPSLLGMLVVAPDFVAVVLGDKWQIATPVIQVLCWVGLLQSLQRLNSSVLQACDRTNDLFRYSVIVTAGSLAAFVLGLHWGLVGVAVAYAISSTAIEPYYTWLTTRALHVRLRDVLLSIRGVLEASVLMAVVTLAVREALVAAGWPPALRLAAVIAVGAAVYIPACAWRAEDVMNELRALRERRRGAAAAPAITTGVGAPSSTNG
jgi:O-antigen/teichoic acid export membrane protein